MDRKPYSLPRSLCMPGCQNSRARICRPFKEPRNRFPAWRGGTTIIFVVPARQATWASGINFSESIPGLLKCLQIRAQGGKVKRINSVKGCGALQNSQCRAGFSAALPCSQTCSKRLTSVHTFSGDKHTSRTRATHSDYFFLQINYDEMLARMIFFLSKRT